MIIQGGEIPVTKLAALQKVLQSDFLNAIREVYEHIYDTVDVQVILSPFCTCCVLIIMVYMHRVDDKYFIVWERQAHILFCYGFKGQRETPRFQSFVGTEVSMYKGKYSRNRSLKSEVRIFSPINTRSSSHTRPNSARPLLTCSTDRTKSNQWLLFLSTDDTYDRIVYYLSNFQRWINWYIDRIFVCTL